MVLQILQINVAAKALSYLDDLFSNATLVETLLSFSCKRAEGLRQCRVLHEVTRQRSSDSILCRRILLQHLTEVRRCLADIALSGLPLYHC